MQQETWVMRITITAYYTTDLRVVPNKLARNHIQNSRTSNVDCATFGARPPHFP
jgi:hypothetical protein